MPIRHCQKCGLKVLIDESQAGANPFYCQRCTTAMKSSDQPEAAPSGNTPVKRDVPSAVLSVPPAAGAPTPAPSGSPSRATVKVLCPYCKASFNGRIPQKPARGACPVCQKELILLPNGDIRPSAGFDVNNWQSEPPAAAPAEPERVPVGAPPMQSNTKLLIKKYAADAPAPAAAAKGDIGTRILPRQQAEPTPVPPTSEPSAPAELPDWLDDAKGGPKPPSRPSTDELIRTKEQQRDPAATEMPEEIPLEPDPAKLPPMEEPEEPPAARPKIVVKPTALRAKPAPPPPAPEPEPAPAPPARKVGTVRKPSAAPAPVASSESTGGGKVFVAWVMLILPVAACPVLLNMKDKLKAQPIVEKVGGMFRKGFFELYKKLNPPPPAPKPPPPPPEERKPEPPPEAPKADPDQQKKDEQKISHIYNEVLQLDRSLKAAGVAASAEQKQAQQQMRDAVDGKKAEIKRLQDQYQKMYNKSYDPANP